MQLTLTMNDLKPGWTDLSQLIAERSPHWKEQEGVETQLWTKPPVRLTTNRRFAPQVQQSQQIKFHPRQPQELGTHTGRTSFHKVWLWKPVGLKFERFYNLWVLIPTTLKISWLNWKDIQYNFIYIKHQWGRENFVFLECVWT